MSKKVTTIDDLARMVQNGFTEVRENVRRDMDIRFETMRKENKKHFEQNATAHEDIKLRLDNVAYRFELQNLEKRVKFLEENAKFA